MTSKFPKIPDGLTEIGSVHISVLLAQEGTTTAFSLSGISREEAIGHLTTVMDRLRYEVSCGWDDDELECPHCGEPYFEEPKDDD